MLSYINLTQHGSSSYQNTLLLLIGILNASYIFLMQQPSFIPDKWIPTNDCIIIVGAGVFGLGTVLELRKRGYQYVFVLDRHMLSVSDASSVDILKVIRVDYADLFYINLGLEALKRWRENYLINRVGG